MTGFSSFQTGFQVGFQVIYSGAKNIVPAYNGNSIRREYQPTSAELHHIERLNNIDRLKAKAELAREALQAKQYQIEELELQRLREGLADENLQNELLMLLIQQKDMQILKLSLARQLQELLDEEEAIMAIMMTMVF